MTLRPSNSLAQEPRYELITQVLRANIASGLLPAGLVLLEGPIAALMQTSRIPVQAALRSLAAEGLVHRFDGRGYLVGAPHEDIAPLRRDIGDFGLNISQQVDDALQTLSLIHI
jgi:DNA-binding GntR family transcriptional regulator